MNRSKAKGTAAESAVVTFLRANGFPHAERRALAGADDLGDVLVTAGVIVECKAGAAAEQASDGQIAAWLDETERERVNANAALALLVTKRKGKGAANAGQWWAHLRGVALRRIGLHPLVGFALDDLRALGALDGLTIRLTLADAVTLLRAAGYGTPLDGEVTR